MLLESHLTKVPPLSAESSGETVEDTSRLEMDELCGLLLVAAESPATGKVMGTETDEPAVKEVPSPMTDP